MYRSSGTVEKLLTICPRDILIRCDLASVLEELGQHEEALFNWKAVLADDSNNLKAREGMARCRLPDRAPPAVEHINRELIPRL